MSLLTRCWSPSLAGCKFFSISGRVRSRLDLSRWWPVRSRLAISRSKLALSRWLLVRSRLVLSRWLLVRSRLALSGWLLVRSRLALSGWLLVRSRLALCCWLALRSRAGRSDLTGSRSWLVLSVLRSTLLRSNPSTFRLIFSSSSESNAKNIPALICQIIHSHCARK